MSRAVHHSRCRAEWVACARGQIKSLGLAPGGPKSADASIASFLLKALDAPHNLAVKNAVELLVQIGALDADEQLTELGYKLANMPMDPRIGKMIVWGQLLGCGKAALKVGCAMAYRDPFVLPLSQDQRQRAERAKQELADNTLRYTQKWRAASRGAGMMKRLGWLRDSDHVALLNALNGFEYAIENGGMAASMHFCDRYFLSRSTLATVHEVVRQVVQEMTGGSASRGNTHEGAQPAGLLL
jgi:HrpA-like RNA helicase